MLTEDERRRAIKFQDTIGEVVDQYLREGMAPNIISEVLRDEASSDLSARLKELEES